jgi:hypothetical protein
VGLVHAGNWAETSPKTRQSTGKVMAELIDFKGKTEDKRDAESRQAFPNLVDLEAGLKKQAGPSQT